MARVGKDLGEFDRGRAQDTLHARKVMDLYDQGGMHELFLFEDKGQFVVAIEDRMGIIFDHP